MMLKSGGVVAYKDGDQIVYMGEDGEWTAAIAGVKAGLAKAGKSGYHD